VQITAMDLLKNELQLGGHVMPTKPEICETISDNSHTISSRIETGF
jgi:hypothetical protein